MQYLLILAPCLIATVKMVIQGAFGKKNVKTLTDAAFFYFGIFLVASLIFSYRFPSASGMCWLFAAVFGAFSAAFQLFYTRALATGPVSLVGLFVNLAMLIPVTFSVIVYKEPITLLRSIGILLILVSFVLSLERGSAKQQEGKSWIFYALVTMLANGACAIVQKIYVKTAGAAADGQTFTACCYLTASVLCLSFFFVMHRRGRALGYRVGKSFFGYVLLLGLLLGGFQAINTYAVSQVVGTLYFPGYYGTSIVMAMLAGVLVCKDKLKVRQVAAILVGTAAVIFVNI